MRSAADHYDSNYFAWQTSIGEFGGWANRTKFSQAIRPSDNVLDFGCGGGFLLKGLNCQGKIGIEVNDAARAAARALGIRTFPSASGVPDQWADVIISNHALEHCENPLGILRELAPKAKSGARVIFVVPCETITNRDRPDDINQHLFTWSPLNLGNLFRRAGYQVEECLPYLHKWPPHYQRIAKLGGRRLFELCCRLYARWNRSGYQVRIVARVP